MSDQNPPGRPYPDEGHQPPYAGQPEPPDEQSPPTQPLFENPPPSPQHGPPQPEYDATQPVYGPPQPEYGPPQPEYGPPQPGYGYGPPQAPYSHGAQQQPTSGAPQPPHGSPQPPYGTPQPTSGTPQYPYGQQPTSGSPQSPYGPPQPGYGTPQSPYGTPTPGTPDSPYGPPQPGYGVPQSPYGQPQNQYGPGYGGPLPAPPPRKRRVGRIIGIIAGSLAVLLLLCCGGAFLLGRDYIDESNASLTTPDTVAGLQKSNRPELQAFVDDLSSKLKSGSELDDVIAALYEDPKAEEKLVMLTGGTKFILRPKSELDDAFDGLRGSELPVQDVADVDAGKLGGTIRCGNATVSASQVEVPLSVCAWADHGSLVVGTFFNRAVTESAELLRNIRSEILHR